MKSASFIYGMSLTGIHPDSVSEAEGFNKAAGDAWQLHKRAAMLAAGIYDAAGQAGSFEHVVFSKVAGSPWNPGYQKFTDSVIDVLGRREMRKSAFKPLAWAKSVAQYATDIPKTAWILSAVMGAGGGALYNSAKRQVSSDTEKADALETRIQHYQQLAKEISEEMKMKGVSPERASQQVLETHE